MQKENSNKIAATYRLTEDQYMLACRQHWQHHKQTGQTNIAFGSVAVLGGIGFMFLQVWLGLLLIFVGSILIAMTLLRSYWWRKAFRDTNYYQQDITTVFSEDNIAVKTSQGDSLLKWSFYESYLETKDFFLLYMNRKAGHFSVIPKTLFDKQQTEQFSKLLSEKLA